MEICRDPDRDLKFSGKPECRLQRQRDVAVLVCMAKTHYMGFY